ncbi:hypothetical protein CAEBREN_10427 [Caenorhabditis brenneri]|uniref:Uncharacterized protein n=1 Tax=Caenorhabditis brenneri TaxID=135651 RepID=G0M7W6_CAEBE|nr:hypothetical protein CAEBREN_10427 [Caenorhabditis brenneri]
MKIDIVHYIALGLLGLEEAKARSTEISVLTVFDRTVTDSEESGGGGPPPDSLEIPDLVRYADHQDPRDHHDPANLDKLSGNFLHHPAVMGSLEKLIRYLLS